MVAPKNTSAADVTAARSLENAAKASPVPAAGWKIRRFVLTWCVLLVLAFAALCGGMVYAISRMHLKSDRIYFNSLSLQTSQSFEATINELGQFAPGPGADLSSPLASTNRAARPQTGGAAVARRTALEELINSADRQLGALRQQADSKVEIAMVRDISRYYDGFRKTLYQPAGAGVRRYADYDRLQTCIDRHRAFNEAQMNEALEQSSRLDSMVDRAAATLIVACSILVLAGLANLWLRVFVPAFHLAQAAHAFSGDMNARAPVLRDDEMGYLAMRFNAMADAMAQREKEKLHFVATVAHDLKNPLMVIGGAARLIQDKEHRLTPEEKYEWLGRISQNTRKLEGMIADLVDGVHGQTGELELNLREVDVATLARGVVADAALGHPSHLVSYSGPESCMASVDGKRMERVLANLVTNAAKYSSAGTEIQVHLKLESKHIEISVRDEGTGITPADLPKLFLPFSRLESNKRMAGGTGLGLASVKKIVEAHGGSVQVESVLGQGSIFRVVIPLQTA